MVNNIAVHGPLFAESMAAEELTWEAPSANCMWINTSVVQASMAASSKNNSFPLPAKDFFLFYS